MPETRGGVPGRDSPRLADSIQGVSLGSLAALSTVHQPGPAGLAKAGGIGQLAGQPPGAASARHLLGAGV
jgi:hypothetical protein